MLQQRVIEELIDMGDTCSSGHSSRFVNVLSEVDVSLRISYEQQLISNLAGRMSALIRNAPNSSDLNLGMMKGEDPKYKEAYRVFFKENIDKLYNELYTEFVTAAYISDIEFERYFQKARMDWADFTE
jgi:hypothetical protein